MFEYQENANTFTIIMSPTLAHIDRADDCITEYINKHPQPVDAFALRILVRESVLNAVEHGCQQSGNGEVRIDLVIEEYEITLTVRDSGKGFNWRERSSYKDELAEGGRGLALMEIYSDRMDFNDAGNELTLKLFSKVESAVNRHN